MSSPGFLFSLEESAALLAYRDPGCSVLTEIGTADDGGYGIDRLIVQFHAPPLDQPPALP